MSDWLRNRLPIVCSALVVAALVPLPLQSGDQVGTLVQVFTVIFLIISLSIHEVAHAVVADWCGDSTAKDLGRITLNPLPHIALFETILLPIITLASSGGKFIFGGAKPVPVSYHRLRHPLRDMMLVAIAGPLSNFLLAGVFCLGWKVAVKFGGYSPTDLLPLVLEQSMNTNLILAAFNMLPIPPLDGSRVMAWLLPTGLREGYVQLERFGLMLVVLVWYFVPGVNSAVWQAVDAMSEFWHIATGGKW